MGRLYNFKTYFEKWFKKYGLQKGNNVPFKLQKISEWADIENRMYIESKKKKRYKYKCD